MPEIDFSLLLPTRHRLVSLERLLKSIVATTHNPGTIEVVLYIDEDDKESQGISEPGLSLIKLISSRETMGKMTNITYEASRGRFIMLMNDDVIFRTAEWDIRVGQSLKAFNDEIILISGNDLYQRGGVGTFPILSRTTCKLMGGICPPEYKYSHIDTHLYDIFKKLVSLGYNRFVYLPGVIFEHMHYEVGKSTMDEIYRAKDPRVDELLYIAWEEERRWLANRLAQYIAESQVAA